MRSLSQPPSLQRRPAVTLVELLVVIAIIGILCAMSFFLFTTAQRFGAGLEQVAQSAVDRAQARPATRTGRQAARPLPRFTPGPATIQRQFPNSTLPPPVPGELLWRNTKPPPELTPALGRIPQAPAGNPLPALPLSEPRLGGQAAPAPPSSGGLVGVAAAPAGNDLLWKSYATSEAFKLHSNPGANHVIYMDFDGHTTSAGNPWNALVNGGNPITSLAWSMDSDRTTFSTAELTKIIELWRMVAEDFIPFDVDVTTEDPGLEALVYSGGSDANWGMRAVIGPQPTVSNPSPWAGAGGIAFLNTFKTATDTVCWNWNGDSSAFPESSLPITVSHEVGHTLGLTHDGDPPLGYYGGHGAGATGWGPIMGAPFGKNVTQWSMNTYPNADNPQDDLQRIVTGWGFSYRPDDHGDTTTSATALNSVAQGTLTTTYGIIEKSTDTDCFQFVADAGPINIQIDPLPVGPNLDIKADLYDALGNLVLSSNPVAKLDATLSTTLPAAGAYHIKITGTALLPVLPAGYPSYGSLGNYRISGTVTALPPQASNFKFLNPLRWTYNRSTDTYSGMVSCLNVSGSTLTGSFYFQMTLPASIQATSPSGSQNGNIFTLSYTGTLPPNQPVRFPVQLRNPQGLPLPTGFNTYFTGVGVTP